MKIEVGESLFYSWLRHAKECQMVQTNWKVSSQWTLDHASEIESIVAAADEHFSNSYGYKVFKQNSSWQQIIKQGECDVVGVSIQDGKPFYYAVEVAFHGAGLNYGDRQTTVMKVVEKLIRAALCLYGYMGALSGEVIFASPKIYSAVLNDLLPCVSDLNSLFRNNGLTFSFRVITNEDFDSHVLNPILLISDDVADTSELFMRSYQLFTMFSDKPQYKSGSVRSSTNKAGQQRISQAVLHGDEDPYPELKVGQLAKSVLKPMLANGAATEEEIALMQQADYSKRVFGLNFPLLAHSDNFDRSRYYVQPFLIRGSSYVLCSQWFETPSNNDRPFLLKWIADHSHASEA
jgi:hypothetical protein